MTKKATEMNIHPLIAKHKDRCDVIRKRVQDERGTVSPGSLILFGYLLSLFLLLAFLLFFMNPSPNLDQGNGRGIKPPAAVPPAQGQGHIRDQSLHAQGLHHAHDQEVHEEVLQVPLPDIPEVHEPIYQSRKQIEFTDANGNPVDPQMYQGREVEYVDVK